MFSASVPQAAFEFYYLSLNMSGPEGKQRQAKTKVSYYEYHSVEIVMR